MAPPRGERAWDRPALARIMGTPAAFDRVLATVPSAYSGITVCQGNFTLMTDDLAALIRRWGAQGKIFFVHFRDVAGDASRFIEVFHDEGPTDMLECGPTTRPASTARCTARAHRTSARAPLSPYPHHPLRLQRRGEGMNVALCTEECARCHIHTFLRTPRGLGSRCNSESGRFSPPGTPRRGDHGRQRSH